MIAVVTFYKWILWGLRCWSKIPCGSLTFSNILLSVYIKTLLPHTVTSSKDRQIGACYFGLTVARLVKLKEEEVRLVLPSSALCLFGSFPLSSRHLPAGSDLIRRNNLTIILFLFYFAASSSANRTWQLHSCHFLIKFDLYPWHILGQKPTGLTILNFESSS